MASKHLLEGLIKWSMRERWADRFEEVLEDHVIPACEETGIEIDDLLPTIGEDLFNTTVWACAFEDFLTREFDGENAIDDYLKRRGWKESASVRTYMAALRNSVMSLYEVSDVVRETSFRARDLIRGGEPILISERSATRSLKPWDCIAARVVQVGSQMQICGGVLHFERDTADAFLEAWRGFARLSNDQKRNLAIEAFGDDLDEEMIADLPVTEMLRSCSPMLTTFWLVDTIDRLQAPRPDLRNSEGDELVLCEARYPLAAKRTAKDIRAVLAARPEFRSADRRTWNWLDTKQASSASGGVHGQQQKTAAFETTLDDGLLVLGTVALEGNELVLSTNSRQRSERGCAMLSELLAGHLGSPSLKTETVEQMIASPDSGVPHQLELPIEESNAIIQNHIDRHYRDSLDQPIPMLGNLSPRTAAKTEEGRIKVAGWLKFLENQTAKAAPGSAVANYSFAWMWTELGIGDLRR